MFWQIVKLMVLYSHPQLCLESISLGSKGIGTVLDYLYFELIDDNKMSTLNVASRSQIGISSNHDIKN
ncbi:MAG: hypothetical protein MHPSP_003379, partial [Paramarteilia canceri]